ncbi:MAG: hypothetical protein IPJ68_04510 [Candidatus Moraniibacteriota bacterium]|nr:MAG: hypothetical protein IPJ68_04510 [Candidatus Moranbacteria bacterium]
MQTTLKLPSQMALVRRLGDRSYGEPMAWDERSEQPLPSFCDAIADEMLRASKLLDLQSVAEHEPVFVAYEQDLRFLQRRLADIVKCVENAVRFSSIRKAENELNPEKEWEKLRASIPSFGQVNMLDLPAEVAAEEPMQVLATLQSGYRNGVNLLLGRMCLWFDTLVGFEFVGQVETAGPATGRYYYYRHSLTHRTQLKEQQVDIEVTDDPEVPFGQRTTYTTLERRRYAEVHDLELHEHHIVRAKRQDIVDFEQPLPIRVRSFIDSLPAWLRPHMQIVSGTITLEKIIRRTASAKEGVEVKVLNVMKGSPVVALGTYALVGWSDDDLRADGGSWSRLQKNYREMRRKHWWRTVMAISAGSIVLVGIIGFFWNLSQEERAEDLAKYQAFVQNFNGEPRHTIKKSELISLPGGQPLVYLGLQRGGGVGARIVLATTLEKAYVEKNRSSYTLIHGYEANTYYGSVDLGTELGIPATVYVISANDEAITFVMDHPRLRYIR